LNLRLNLKLQIKSKAEKIEKSHKIHLHMIKMIGKTFQIPIKFNMNKLKLKKIQ